ncbi:nucleoside recognition domain-containing protein [Alicyclobacillus kakegawensis]|uniref:nucleoside recognition domain-containing protein n=1 Tax=Alicyclobacillus kakegawensis TaxID=392012 RepID=UPI000830B18C|nr:nucleoside recognition domain-containing protein [Alicyclobacillus kakegawensis]
MIDLIWLGLFLAGVTTAMFTGHMQQVTVSILGGAEHGVELSLALIGVIALWNGLMGIAEKAGLIDTLARVLRPVARWLYPSVPENHPAMGAILANMSANLLGIGNAATPLGLRAMRELQTLNADKETASDAMCTLLAVNTASITLIPTTVIAVRMQYGSTHPTSVVGTTIIATALGTVAAIVLDRGFRAWDKRRRRG